MIGYKFQGKGYGVHVLQAVIDDMINMYDCKEIYLSVIVNNDRAIRLYEKLGFKHR
nr:GNAT family N-acetyltransferase [Metabacillus litoralis]